MMFARISFWSAGLSRCHCSPSTVNIFITLTGLSARGVLIRTSGGSSFMMTCFEQVFPDPAAPTKRAVVLYDLTWPCFMASSKRRLDLTVEVVKRRQEKLVEILRGVGPHETAKMMQDFNCYCNIDVNHSSYLLLPVLHLGASRCFKYICF